MEMRPIVDHAILLALLHRANIIHISAIRAYLGEKSRGWREQLLRTLLMERRSQTRVPDSEFVTLCWEECSATLTQLGSIDNKSADGVGIRVDHAIPVGSQVTISLRRGTSVGIVRHLALRTGEHFVGIEFVLSDK
jgi:hypothetical protein